MKTLIHTYRATAAAFSESKQALKATKKRMKEVSEAIQMYKAIIAMPPRVDSKTYLLTNTQ